MPSPAQPEDVATATEHSASFTVLNKMGIHARPAAMIVRAANRHPHTEVWVRRGNEQINGKSIMGLMMLAAAQGTRLEITAIGPEAAVIIDELKTLFERRFDEA